jgi:hypothetical protein
LTQQGEQQLLAFAQRPEVAVVLCDVMLGWGATADPAGALATAWAEAQQIAREWTTVMVLPPCAVLQMIPRATRSSDRYCKCMALSWQRVMRRRCAWRLPRWEGVALSDEPRS